MFDILLEHGVDINQRYLEANYTALYIAIKEGQSEYVTMLIAAGADVNARVGTYQRPLLLHFVGKGYEEAVRVLIAAGADVAAADSLGWTPWRLATYYGKVENVAALETAGATWRVLRRRWRREPTSMRLTRMVIVRWRWRVLNRGRQYPSRFMPG